MNLLDSIPPVWLWGAVLAAIVPALFPHWALRNAERDSWEDDVEPSDSAIRWVRLLALAILVIASLLLARAGFPRAW